ncbi:cell division protein FtsX [Acuticoccus yangtzensis]|uniref:cell division protein FtsX n=1 Tax=Acuticoccus yangtzensis TaxID=1443441 RepID=UPI000949AA3C|nr:hypothetical protein [Acuticoccus yangtzensis]
MDDADELAGTAAADGGAEARAAPDTSPRRGAENDVREAMTSAYSPSRPAKPRRKVRGRARPVDPGEDQDRPTEDGPIVSPRSIAGRGLVAVVAIMTFLCALLAGSAVIIDRAAGAWSATVLDEITVTVLPLDGDPIEGRLDRAAAILSAAPGVDDVAIVSAAESEALLEPWLGEGIDLSPLPIPRLVTARRGGDIDTDALTRELTAIAGTSLDDHSGWSERLSAMASAVAGGAIAALLLMLCATAMCIVFATRSAIATNAATVEVLAALGAEDRFITRAFGRRFVAIGARGAAIGLSAALLLFGGLELWSALSSGAQSAQSRALLGDPGIGLKGYLILLAVAAGVTLTVAVTSTRAVRHHLERMVH